MITPTFFLSIAEDILSITRPWIYDSKGFDTKISKTGIPFYRTQIKTRKSNTFKIYAKSSEYNGGKCLPSKIKKMIRCTYILYIMFQTERET